MEHLGVVSAFAARGWRPYAGPFAFLLAATIAIGLLRGHLAGHATPASAPSRARRAAAPVRTPHRHVTRRYVVRAGDTIDAIASRTGTTTAQILRLNPKVSPTALFIGERLRLR
jgi:Tfp pilus assembly protein FimV